MWRELIFFPKFCTLCHPKAVLLVDNGEAQVVEVNFLFNNRMGTDEQVQRTVGQGFENGFAFCPFYRARQEGNFDVHIA